jgi:hypothetical protein
MLVGRSGRAPSSRFPLEFPVLASKRLSYSQAMEEPVGTIFTVLLFIAAFLGSGAYAVLSMADFRAARRGFYATAASFAVIGLVLGTMATWPLPIRMAICAAFFGVSGKALVRVLKYLRVRETLGIENVKTQSETDRLVSKSQFEKVSQLAEFFGSKDEHGLRETFDLGNIIQKNINTQIIRIGFIKSGREKEFFYNNYSDNGNFIFWAKEGHFTTGPSGVHINAGPQDVFFLVTTNKYQLAKKRLVEFINSALIPESIKKEVSAFDKVLNDNTELMTRILNEKMHEDENYFLSNMSMGSPFYGVIVSDFARRMTQLKPAADRVLSAIAASWKISQRDPH